MRPHGNADRRSLIRAAPPRESRDCSNYARSRAKDKLDKPQVCWRGFARLREPTLDKTVVNPPRLDAMSRELNADVKRSFFFSRLSLSRGLINNLLCGTFDRFARLILETLLFHKKSNVACRKNKVNYVNIFHLTWIIVIRERCPVKAPLTCLGQRARGVVDRFYGDRWPFLR